MLTRYVKKQASQDGGWGTMILIVMIDYYVLVFIKNYFLQVGNTGSNFQHKINALISKVAWSVGLDIGDRLTKNARKVKFVVDGPLPPDNVFPERFRDFEVCHHYLQTPTKSIQSRLRKRGRKVITVI